MPAEHKQSAYERNRIETITEGDFWSAWSAGEAALKNAAGLGKAGRKARAYRALAKLHREALAAEYAFARSQAEQRNATARARRRTFAAAADLRRGRVHWPATCERSLTWTQAGGEPVGGPPVVEAPIRLGQGGEQPQQRLPRGDDVPPHAEVLQVDALDPSSTVWAIIARSGCCFTRTYERFLGELAKM